MMLLRQNVFDEFNDTRNRILQMLKGGKSITSEMIVDLIGAHNPIASYYRAKYEEYKASDAAIYHRQFEDPTKINNKLHNDFIATIVNQSAGYVFGKNIVYNIDSNKYDNETLLDDYKEHLEKFVIRNHLYDLDNETGKDMGIYGVAYRLCYIDVNGEEAVINLKPWETIVLEENEEVFYGMRYYLTYDSDGNKIAYCEWYDDTNITIFKSETHLLHTSYQLTEVRPHMFTTVPVIKFRNNEEEANDYDKVLTLVDAYDRLISDSQNELEEFRLAYMVFEGAEIDKETVIAARQTGAFSLPVGSTAKFLTKMVDVNTIEHQRKTLEMNIFRFAQAVNMDDEKFSGGNQTGESRKWKLIALEDKAIIKERKFTRGLRQMFKVICSSFDIRGKHIDYLDVYFTFRRNLPVDMSYLADVATKLQGIVSNRTILESISLVDDVDYELRLLDAEKSSLFDDNYLEKQVKEADSNEQ